ncbi:MAG: V4R domain-containing protein [Candidatus Micrarchaeia archaeon]
MAKSKATKANVRRAFKISKEKERKKVKKARKQSKIRLRSNIKPKARAKQRAIKQANLPASLEGLLEERITGKKSMLINEPMVEDIIYNATPSMRGLAYKSGFSFGMQLGEKSGKRIDKLFEVLGAAGLENILYYPFEDRAVIKASSKGSYNIGKLVHIYESGIIAGFLTSTTGKTIYVKEDKCAFNGDNVCEFVAEPKASIKPEEDYDENVVENLTKVISSEGSRRSQEYMLFSMLPLMKEPIKDEIAKVFYAAGSKLGEKGVEPEKLGGKFGIKIARTKKGFVLSYSPLNSLKGFVDISSALFAGMARSMGSKSVELRESPTKENTYKVYIRLA